MGKAEACKRRPHQRRYVLVRYSLNLNQFQADASPEWKTYHNDMNDMIGWIYGGWGRRMQIANEALIS